MNVPNWLDWLLGGILSAYQKSDLPGKFWFYQHTKRRFGRLLIRHRVEYGNFWVPWDQWCFWLEHGPCNYYLDDFNPLANEISSQPAPVDFIDLGADIGVVSQLMKSRCQNLRQVIAIEPNPSAFRILEKNLSAMPGTNLALRFAVSDCDGMAKLLRDEGLGSDHEGHIERDPNGDIPVRALDSVVSGMKLELSDNIAVKIDVEGQEVNTIKGMASTLKRANTVIMMIEIHPDVLARDGETPESILLAAESIRDFEWVVPVAGNKKIDRKRAFFEQFPEQQYDIIGVSRC